MAVAARRLIEAFEQRFRSTPELFRAPGRVNLIGEHTDYNLGFVLPIAIDLGCHAASARNDEGVLRLYSLNLEQAREWPLDHIAGLTPARDWSDYVLGVIRQIPQPRGLDLMVNSTVPLGSGLSSSAALEVSTALAAGWDVRARPKLELAKLCQRAENEFIGLPSGIMDQYASVFGEAGAAVKIDCRSLEHETVRLPPGCGVVAVNTMVKHELGQSAYRERVAECRRAVDLIRMHRPEVESLRDATIEDLQWIAEPVPQCRARHVVTENQRVAEFAEACRNNDPTRLGRLMVASHRSLQQDYEVSCGELDFLVDAALAIEGVHGARMTGGGFGGCTVNLVDHAAEDGFEFRIRMAYAARFGKEPAVYRIRATQGASKVF